MKNKKIKRVNQNKNKINKYIVIFILLILFSIIFLFINYNKKNISSYRIVEIISLPARKISEGFSYLKEINNAIKNNKKLEEEITSLKIIKKENEELSKEISKLNKLLELKKIYSMYDLKYSSVIERNTLYWFDTFTIDKGSNDNISLGDPVVTEKGLVGKIDKITTDYSVVKMITNLKDSNISVGVKASDSYVHGIITGFKDNLIIVNGTTNYDKVNINSKVVTSGLGNFPAGILVGYVQKIEKDNYGISKILYVEPVQDINDIKYVAVLKDKK